MTTATVSPAVEIAALAAKWRDAKRAEAVANAYRIQVEEEIVALVGVNVEGGKTHKFEGFKIEVTGKLSRRCTDWNLFAAVTATFPPELVPAKRALDETGVKWLQKNRADLYALLAPALEVKPAKTAVSIEFTEA